MFGSGAFKTQTATGPSTFGQQPAFGQPAASGGLFGSQPQQNTTSLFGQQKPGFGAPAPILGQPMTQQAIPAQAPLLWDLVNNLKESWNPSSPHCQFRHYFYNIVHPSEVQLYSKPPNHDETLWRQAMQDNPDPSCMVPVIAIGFEDIKKRMDQQEKANTANQGMIEDAGKILDSIRRKHHLETTVKLDEFKRRQLELAHRALQLMKRILILRNKGYSIRADEESLKVRVEGMLLQLKKPSQFRGRIHELNAQLSQLNEFKRLNQVSMNKPGMDYEVVDPDSLRLVFQTLAETQSGLSHLTQVLKVDTADIEMMAKNYANQWRRS